MKPLYDVIEFLGFFLVFTAVLGRLWCTIYIGGRKDMVLCRKGPYSVSRNPLYLFSFLGLLGVCLAAQNLILSFVSAVAFLLYYRIVILNEEKRLTAIFGADFISYMSEVPRFFPRLVSPDSGEPMMVDPQVYIRAIIDVSWFLAAIVGIEVIEELRLATVISGWNTPV